MIGVTTPRTFAVEEKTTMTTPIKYVKWDQNGKSHYILLSWRYLQNYVSKGKILKN